MKHVIYCYSGGSKYTKLTNVYNNLDYWIDHYITERPDSCLVVDGVILNRGNISVEAAIEFVDMTKNNEQKEGTEIE